MTTIITKNSSTSTAVPAAGDLVKGELAVNVTDKKLYTKDNSATVVKVVGSLGNQEANAVAITGGTVAGVAQTGGTINNTPIGATTAAAVTGTTITATTGFSGTLTGNVTGNTTGTHTGAVTGNVTGNLTGNVTASSGTSTFNHVTISGSLDMDAGTSSTITGLATPVNNTDAATKIYVDTAISNLVDGAPANLDTLNEIAAALNDDANIATTLTNAIATKVSKSGDTMSGALAMGTNKITGLGTPTAGTDATTKTYVDDAVAAKLSLSGGTMSGAIAMGSNKITGLGTPTSDADATTKVYVDGILGSATSAAASASAAATSATNAANSASSASSSASAASASASSAAASYDSFDDRYLGSKSSAPTVDNDGNALLTGALYWNSTSSNLWVWNGSAWGQATLDGSAFIQYVAPGTSGNVLTSDGTTWTSAAAGLSSFSPINYTTTGTLLAPVYFNQCAPEPSQVGSTLESGTGKWVSWMTFPTGNSLVTSFEFTDLRGIAGGGSVNFSSMSSLTSLSFPALTTVGGASFGGNLTPNLVTLSFPLLSRMAGNFAFQNMNSLTTLTLSSLEFVGGSFSANTMNSLTSLSLPALTTVVGNLNTNNMSSVTSVSMPSLSYTGGGYSISSMPLVTSLDHPALVTVGGIFGPGAMTGLTTINLPVIERIGTTISSGSAIQITNSTASLSSFTLGASLKQVGTGGGNVVFTSCALNQASVDNILIRLAALDGTNGTTTFNNRTVTITGTSATPSSAGLTAKATLVARGCTVTNN